MEPKNAIVFALLTDLLKVSLKKNTHSKITPHPSSSTNYDCKP